MPDTTANRYNVYFGFFVIGLILFVVSLFVPGLETLYAVLFFLAGLNMIFSTQKPKQDPLHSASTHFEIYSRDNVVNYILAAMIIVQVIISLIVPISKPIVILVMWIFNLYAYPRFMIYFSDKLGKQLVSNYLQEQIPELSKAQISGAVVELNTQPDVTSQELAAKYKFSDELAERLIVLYRKYLEQL